MAWVENALFDSQGFVLNVPRWDFPDSGISCILGESGSGKTTFLQMIAGLIPSPGLKLSLQNELVSDLPPRARNFGFVFQDYALFPHMTAWQNIAFAPEARKIPAGMWETFAESLVNRLGLARVRDQKALKLSGGEQQRVALARALVTKPRLVLLDEPLSALDEKLRDDARVLISDLSAEYQVPFLFVTHDLRDVRAVAGHVLLLANGKVLASGTVPEVLDQPATLEAAAAIGENRTVPFVFKNGKPHVAGVEINPGIRRKSPVSKLIGKNWSFQAVAKGTGRVSDAVVEKSIYEGGRYKLIVKLPDGHNIVAWAATFEPKAGTQVDLNVDEKSLVFFEGSDNA